VSDKLLSDQKIGQIVSDKAEKLSQMQQQVRATLSKTQSYELKVNSKVDIYHPNRKKFCYLMMVSSERAKPKGKRQARIGRERHS